MITTEEIERTLKTAFPGAWVSVEDMTGTSDHFDIVITSELFRGKPLIEQHRMVQSALVGEMESRIHAVKIKTRIP